jgi:hypothetical protein
VFDLGEKRLADADLSRDERLGQRLMVLLHGRPRRSLLGF